LRWHASRKLGYGMRPVRGGSQPFGIGLFERLLLPGIAPLHGSVNRGWE